MLAKAQSKELRNLQRVKDDMFQDDDAEASVGLTGAEMEEEAFVGTSKGRKNTNNSVRGNSNS